MRAFFLKLCLFMLILKKRSNQYFLEIKRNKIYLLKVQTTSKLQFVFSFYNYLGGSRTLLSLGGPFLSPLRASFIILSNFFCWSIVQIFLTDLKNLKTSTSFIPSNFPISKAIESILIFLEKVLWSL